MHKNNPIKSSLSLRKKAILTIFGILLALAFLELGLRLGGFVFLSLQEYRNRAAIYKKGTYRIMCLGESTTAIGGKDSYPSQLEEILNQHNTGIKFSVINKGVPNINTFYIMAHLEENLNRYRPDMVTAMIGLNDKLIKYYEDIPEANTFLFNKLRTYRLARLLWINMSKSKASPRRSNFSATVLIEKNDEELKKAIELNPENGMAYIKLGRFYIGRGKFIQAEELFKKAIELNPGNDNAYLGLGHAYKIQGKLSQAEELFKKAIELNPGNDNAYLGLGYIYEEQGKFSQAEELFKKAIKLNSGNDNAYLGLGHTYEEQGKLSQAEELFKKAIELNLNPGNDNAYLAYVGLGHTYEGQGKFSQAEELFKKAIKLNPGNDNAYLSLGHTYEEQGKLSQAEELFKKAIELNPKSEKMYRALSILYKEIGNTALEEMYDKKANELSPSYYNLTTINNYRKLKEILDKKGIKLACIQYPMHSIEPLKKMFDGQDGVLFVDNEKLFKEALKKSSYREYFIDIFGGDFGHCTREGNRIIAQNLANVILKDYFRNETYRLRSKL